MITDLLAHFNLGLITPPLILWDILITSRGSGFLNAISLLLVFEHLGAKNN